MNDSNASRGYVYSAGTIVAAYLISLVAWLDYRGEVKLIPRSAVGCSVEAWIDTALLIVITPGWFIVTVVRGDRPGTKLTDTFIPILSGVFGGLLAIRLKVASGGCGGCGLKARPI